MSLTHKSIFIVEDKLSNSFVMELALQGAGATTYLDRWGTHTVQRLKQLKIDLILMDLMLPNGMTGYEVFDKIKAEAELTHIPIIVVSASDVNVEMNKAREKGFKGYISKPINAEKFPQIVESILNGEEVWGSSSLDDIFG